MSLSEMRNSYEVADYIDSEILGTLSKRESDFLEIGSWCPWINGKMCEDIWKISDGMETIKNLERKGFLTECGKEQYATAALFRKEACRQNPKRKFWMTVGAWYEAEGFIKEGLFCMTNANEKEALKHLRFVIMQRFRLLIWDLWWQKDGKRQSLKFVFCGE